jgi:hypothetical protein
MKQLNSALLVAVLMITPFAKANGPFNPKQANAYPPMTQKEKDALLEKAQKITLEIANFGTELSTRNCLSTNDFIIDYNRVGDSKSIRTSYLNPVVVGKRIISIMPSKVIFDIFYNTLAKTPRENLIVQLQVLPVPKNIIDRKSALVPLIYKIDGQLAELFKYTSAMALLLRNVLERGQLPFKAVSNYSRQTFSLIDGVRKTLAEMDKTVDSYPIQKPSLLGFIDKAKADDNFVQEALLVNVVRYMVSQQYFFLVQSVMAVLEASGMIFEEECRIPQGVKIPPVMTDPSALDEQSTSETEMPKPKSAPKPQQPLAPGSSIA